MMRRGLIGESFARVGRGRRPRGVIQRFRLGTEQLERRRALAVITPFTIRYQTNDTGDITFAANTLMTAPPSDPAAVDAQNGVGSKVANNDFLMTYVDVDTDPTTFNSSRSDLVMPAGSQVLFAGLYWGARTNGTTVNASTTLRDTVKFMTPGGAVYQELTGSPTSRNSNDYQSFKDVTSLVAGAGAGTYTVANVQAQKDKTDTYAGWSLVVVYRAPGEPARNLTVFDGYASVSKTPSSNATVNIPISGFKAPTTGPVKATLGFIAYEGDLAKTGDTVKFDGKSLSDAANPVNDFFNSTISNRGTLISTKDPNYVNQLGYDADLITADGIVTNGATSATITMTTGGETYYPGVVTSAIEIFAPEIAVVKSVMDENGGDVVGGDVLTYTMTVTNRATALDTAINVLLTDAIPVGTTYKPNSLAVTAGANAGSKSDAADGDQAQFVVGTNSVQFQLGTGAGGVGTSGGRLAPGQSTAVTFQVTVDADPPPLTLIENTTNVSYSGAISGFQLNATDFADIATQGAADLAVTKTDGKTQYVPGTTTTYTIVVTNNGPSAVTGARVLDTFPSQIEGATWTASYSTGSAFANPTTGSGDIDTLIDLLNGGTATFVVTAPVRAGAFGDLANTVTVTNPVGVPDPDPSDNSATDVDTFLAPGNLVLDKTVQDLNGGFVVAGDVLRYTIIVRSGTAGVVPSSQEAAANVILTDVVPTNTTFVSGSLRVRVGANAGFKTDAVDADQGEISGTNTVQFQLGTGAGAGTGTPVGGTLAAGTYTEVEFDVTVDAGIPDSTVITNTADVTAIGATSGLPISATDTVGIATAPAADLFISKRAQSTFTPGGTVAYIITVGNKGPSAVTGATVVDTLPAGLSGATWTATYSGGSTGPASGSGSINTPVDLAVFGAAVFRITATADADFPLNQTLTNRATVTGPTGIPDPNLDNNTDTRISTPAALTDLAVTKTDGQTQYVPGQQITYTITVTNNGPSFASQVSVVDTLDPLIISSASWSAQFTGTGSNGTASGTGSLGELIDLAVGGTAVYTVVAQTLPGATGSLVNTVTVATNDLANDPNPVNNTATDTDTLLLPGTLAVAKSVVDVNSGFVVAGDTLRYTIVVTNPASTTSDPKESVINVTLDDVIPLFTTYVDGSVTSNKGSITGSQTDGVAGTIGTLAAGESATITFDVTVNAGIPDSTTITNTARAAGVGDMSGTELDTSGRVVIMTPPGADLKIVKTAPATYVPGLPLTYTLVVSNLGPTASTNALVTDTLSTDLTGATWTVSYAGGATGPASGSGNVNATLTSLPANATATFTITATADYRLDAPLVNRATVTATDGLIDPDLDNNTSTVSSDPAPVADLQITKTDGVTSYVPGQQLVYTITVTNAGPSFVTGAVVTDLFDASIITSATWTARIAQGQADLRGQVRGTGSLDQTIDIGPSGIVVYTVTAMTTSAATATLVNTATVTAPAGTTDPIPSNNESADVDTVAYPARLTVVKTVRDLNGGVLVAGDTLRYTIVVSNPATPLPAEAATNVILSDVIPANTTYKRGTLRITAGANAGAKTDAVDRDQGEYSSSFNTVYFQLGAGAGAGTGVPVGGTLAAGQSTTVTFDVTVNAGTPLGTAIINTALATATASITGIPLQAEDSVGISLSGGSDLAIVKTAPATYTPGLPLTYTLVVTNSGPSTSTDALVQDILPDELIGASWTAVFAGGATGTASGSGHVITNVTLPRGGRATYTITATADATLEGVLTNTATVSPTDGDPDPNPENNTATGTSAMARVADLQIVKTDASATYTPGLPVIYTITVTNAGPSFVRGATVADLFPATITAASWTAAFTGTGSIGSAAGTGSIDEVVDLAVGGTAVYTVIAETSPSATTSLVNTATVAAPPGTTDPTPANNTSTDTDTVLLAAKLALTKTVADLTGDPNVVQAGDTLRYTIVVSNNSGAVLPAEAAVGVFFSDPIPANTTFVVGSITPGSLAYSAANGVTGSLGTIAAGQAVTITFDVTVDAGTADSTVITNVAAATGSGETTGLPLSASDSVGVVTPPGADLTIVKTGPATFTPGGSLTYTIVVTNLGPSDVANVSVADTLPAELSGVTWAAVYDDGAAGPASGSGGFSPVLTSLPSGGSATFTITAAVSATALSALTNTATVTAPDGFPDPNPDDNTSTVISVPLPVTALSITKSDGTTAYQPGQPVTYTIVVTNAGPSFVQGAQVTDVLDPTVIDVAASTWTAVFTGTNSSAQTIGTGSINETIDLAVGGTVTYTVVAQTLASATTDLVNTAAYVAPDGSTGSATDVDVVDFTPALLLGTDIGCTSTPLVQVVDPLTGLPLVQFYAYEPSFRGGVHVFGYDVTGDGIPEIVTAPGPGRQGEVRVFTQTGTRLPEYSFSPYGSGYTGGVEIAGGSVTSPGVRELVTGQQKGPGTVRVYGVNPGVGVNATPVREVQPQPFVSGFRGGVTLATADLGTFAGSTYSSAVPDGISEIIVGSGPGTRATVKTYNAVPARPVVVNTIQAISPGYSNGVSVAVLPVAAGVADKYLVSAGVSGGSKVETYSGVKKIPDAAFAAFGGASGRRGDVWTTALDETQIFSVQGQFGKTAGINKNTAPSGGTSSTLPGSLSAQPPLRIGSLRRLPPIPV